MATNKEHGIRRILSKLEETVNNGEFYEAHQIYRTLYFRYMSQRKYDELLDMLYDGATTLMVNNQRTSGADLAILFVDVLVKSDTPVSNELFNKIFKLFELIGPNIPEREKFLNNALQWSVKAPLGNKKRNPYFHQNIAQIFWKERNYAQARYHFLHSCDGHGYALMLVELHKSSGYPNEVDLFIAQAVLQYLCHQNKRSAKEVFESYVVEHPDIDQGPPFELPLLNFIWMLLEAVENGKLEEFRVLREKYEPSISRDPSYSAYLDKISQIYFGVPTPKQKSHGLLWDLLRSLARDDAEAKAETSGRNPTASTSRQDKKRND